MRREGYEIAVSRPQVIVKEIDGELCEPYETLVADVEEANQGGVIQGLAERAGKMQNMVPDGKGRVRPEYPVPSRGLIGFQPQFMTMPPGRSDERSVGKKCVSPWITRWPPLN